MAANDSRFDRGRRENQGADFLAAMDVRSPADHDIFNAGVHYTEGEEFGKFWGEDMDFCNRWRAIGGRIWLDTNIKFQHAGRKTWEANYLDFLRANHAVKVTELPSLDETAKALA